MNFQSFGQTECVNRFVKNASSGKKVIQQTGLSPFGRLSHVLQWGTKMNGQPWRVF